MGNRQSKDASLGGGNQPELSSVLEPRHTKGLALYLADDPGSGDEHHRGDKVVDDRDIEPAFGNF